MHPAPSSSTHPHLAHFNLHPALCNALNIIRTKIFHVIGQFPQIQVKSCPFSLKIGAHGILEVLILDPDIEVSTSKSVFGQIWVENWKLFILTENWHTCYLEDADSFSDISFWVSNSKSILGQISAKKVKLVRFAWKLAHMVSRGCWFLFRN